MIMNNPHNEIYFIINQYQTKETSILALNFMKNFIGSLK